jgi:dTDP-glucose 4,6-dehydratase
MQSPVADDLERILTWVSDDLRELRGARLFITGGTGYVGTWLLEALAFANERLQLGIRATVLTRSPEHFAAAAPGVAAHRHFSFIEGDVRSIRPDLGTFDAIVHAATPASAELLKNDPQLMLDTIVEGGRSVLALAARSGAIPFLFTSSGAVYGRLPATFSRVDEGYAGAPDPLEARSAYHEGKRVGELQCALAAERFGLKPKIARIFAQVGPYLPLDIHYAMGNFINDVLEGRTVRIQGDGTTVRSYMYAADTTAWLLRILVRGGSSRAYNVGSETAISMRDLAERLAATVVPALSVEIAQTPDSLRPVDRYVPANRRAREELGLEEWTPLDQGIERTLLFYRNRSNSST